MRLKASPCLVWHKSLQGRRVKPSPAKKGCDTIAQRITDAERLARIKTLFPDDAEAQDILAYDKAVDAGQKTPYDLPPDKEKAARKYAHTGTRKTPTTYKFTKRERKPNATKGGIIAELADFMEHNSNFNVSNLAITNKERQISFMVSDETFELTLVQKRKPKS